MLSIIIPSRNEQYLQRTVDELLAKAEGEVEVIVVLDGYWTKLRDDPRVIIIHQGTVHNNYGMRAAINAGMAIARGEYVMKIDEHCMVDQGYDLKLAADCQDGWVVVPRRYRLDPEKWELIEDGRPPIDYMFIDYPYRVPLEQTSGLYGSEWRAKHHERRDVLIDDTMSWQGSCWFTTKKHWDNLLDPLDDINYGPFNHEAQEIGNKTWLSGGRLVVNKKTWYAHFHKGKKGKGYGFSREQYRRFMADKEKARRYAIEYWLTTQDYKHDWAWLMDRFWPVPNWPDNWREQLKEDRSKDWSTLGRPTWEG